MRQALRAPLLALLPFLLSLPGSRAVAASIPPSALLTPPSPLVRAVPVVGDLHILSYHDVIVDEAARRNLRDQQAVSLNTLVRHFSWLRDNGYAVVTMAEVVNARSGGKPLPPRAVLLSFDDAYKSFHVHVLPLLELFDFSATLAVVGLWIETADTETIPFGDEKLSRTRFMTWLELRDVVASGRVEIASHSFDLHRGHISNPQRNVQPSATSLRFDVGQARYETIAELAARVRQDLQRNNELLWQRIGVRPRVMVWPYGAHTPGTQRIATDLGLTVGLTLENGVNHIDTPLVALNRVLVQADTDVADLERALRPQRERTERSLEVDLDTVFDVDNAVQEKRLSGLLDRLQALAPSTIYLKSISAMRNPDGRPSAYFPTEVLPLRGDLFNRVAWQVRSRLGISVFAWLPTDQLQPNLTQTAAGGGERALATLFADLARSVPIAGVYFSEIDHGLDARVNALIQAVNTERPRLQIARRFAPPTEIAATAADVANDVVAERSRWAARTAGIDWIVLAPPSRVAQSADPSMHSDTDSIKTVTDRDTAEPWGVSPVAVEARRAMEQRLVLWAQRGVPLDRVLWRAPDTSGASVRALAALHAAGVRHFGYGAALGVDAAASNELRRSLSTEGTPIAR